MTGTMSLLRRFPLELREPSQSVAHLPWTRSDVQAAGMIGTCCCTKGFGTCSVSSAGWRCAAIGPPPAFCTLVMLEEASDRTVQHDHMWQHAEEMCHAEVP